MRKNKIILSQDEKILATGQLSARVLVLEELLFSASDKRDIKRVHELSKYINQIQELSVRLYDNVIVINQQEKELIAGQLTARIMLLKELLLEASDKKDANRVVELSEFIKSIQDVNAKIIQM